MTKLEFISLLEKALSDFPQKEVRDRLSFYSEMIADHMEEGLSEAEAVSAVGSVEEIAAQVASDLENFQPIKTDQPKRSYRVGTIVLLIFGSPVWIPLLLAAFAVVLSIYITLWAGIVSLWAVWVSLAACACSGAVAGGWYALSGYPLAGLAMVAVGMVCAGLSVFLFYGCRAATKGALLLAKNGVLRLKKVL